MDMSFSKKILAVVIALGVMAVLAMAMVGASNNFTQVPYWDMWNGFLGFYTNVKNGGIQLWWGPHNEHRIVVARILFWLDLSLFSGNLRVLIALNYLSAAAAVAVFYNYIKLAPVGRLDGWGRGAVTALIAAWLFSWIQAENFTWGFQTQFFLAQLFPLAAFLLLYKSAAEEGGIRSWLLACILGVVSVGTMANGVLALPLMALYSIVVFQPWRRSVGLIVLSALTVRTYFQGIPRVDSAPSFVQTLSQHPADTLGYVLRYLGSPYYFFLGSGKAALMVAMASALLLIAATGYFAIRALRAPKNSKLELSLITFILYIGGSAVATAAGRLEYGVDQAFGGRYTTTALMMWAAFFCLILVRKYDRWPSHINAIYLQVFSLAAIAICVPYQMKALAPHQEELFTKDVGALALTMGVRDDLQIGTLFPNSKIALEIVKEPIRQRLSVFGMPNYLGVEKLVGSKASVPAPQVCVGNIDAASLIDSDQKFIRVSGWIYDPAAGSVPKNSMLVDAAGIVVGYVITGGHRVDVSKAIDANADFSGFSGYLLRSEIGKNVLFQAINPGCVMNKVVPVAS
ncbi:hypothetical protein [Pseudomonas putida]